MIKERRAPRHEKRVRASRNSVLVPQPWTEYAYYALILYGLVAVAWGLSIPLVAAGGLAILAVYCVWTLRNQLYLYKPIIAPLGCAISFLLVQFAFHGGSPMDTDSRGFVTWILGLIIVQCLGLRKGFFHRFAFAALTIGLMLIPYLSVDLAASEEVERSGLESTVGLSNPNDLAAWFGFLAVYFAILGIEAKRNSIRFTSLFVAAACLAVVGITVSRGALLGVAVTLTIASRRLLKRGFIPVLVVILIGGVALSSGLFDRAIAVYSERGMEETGRLLVWPLAISRFLESPVIGVGAANSGTYVPEADKGITPHNSFLYFALTAGIVPFLFYVGYWIKAVRGAYHWGATSLPEAPFQLPLCIYTFITLLFGAFGFMFPWVIVTLSTAMLAGAPSPGRRMRRIRRRETVTHSYSNETSFSELRYDIHSDPPRRRKTSSD